MRIDKVAMKITGVSWEEYSYPHATPLKTGGHVSTHAGVAVARVFTEEGIEGVGMGAASIVGPALVGTLERELIGENPMNVERLWHKMWVPKLVGRRGMTTRVISAIDIALWDLRGKIADQPLYRLLGGYRERVPAYIAGGYYLEGKTLDDLAQEMLGNVEAGATAVKMKVGGVPINEDVERVKVVREAIGPGIKLMVDANCAYRYYEAIQFARKIEPFDIYWFEEPVAPDDYEGHARVARSSSIPVATGENEYTRYGFRDLIQHGSASILNADAQILGGITEFMNVASLAAAHDLHIAPHGAQEVHIHLVAAIPNGLILEFYRETVNPLHGRIFKESLTLDADGCVSVPQTPGLGMEPNWEVLEPYRVA
jgi:L-alanine-DL-glutamate epimerase-like enolase superfamily enzyme